MPLFHSNSLMVGLAPALVAGASVGLARRFTASRLLDDVRHYGATWFNYTGKPLAYLLATARAARRRRQPAAVGLRQRGLPPGGGGVRRALRRGRSSTSSAPPRVASRSTGSGAPRGARWASRRQGIKIVDADGDERPRADFDADGTPRERGGMRGGDRQRRGRRGPFEGYYRNDEAMARTTRNGWYWSGDLGYVDADGWVYFAGRTSDWLRVDGENFPAAPIEAIVARHPDVMVASAYGVPDADAGDQVMMALVLRGRGLRPRRLRRVARRPDRPEPQVAPALRAAQPPCRPRPPTRS